MRKFNGILLALTSSSILLSTYANVVDAAKSFASGKAVVVKNQNDTGVDAIVGPGERVVFFVGASSEYAKLELEFDYKGEGIKLKKGAKNHEDARFAINFFDRNRKRVGDWPKIPNLRSSKDWETWKFTYDIPAGCERIELNPYNMCEEGTLRIRNLRAELISGSRKGAPIKEVKNTETKKTASAVKADVSGNAKLKSNRLSKELFSEGSWSKPFGKATLDKTPSGAMISANPTDRVVFAFDVPKSMGQLVIEGSIKGENIKRGDATWQDGRIAINFYDRNRKHLGVYPTVPSVVGTKDWKSFKCVYDLPLGCEKIEVCPSHFGKEGFLRVKDFKGWLVECERVEAAKTLNATNAADNKVTQGNKAKEAVDAPIPNGMDEEYIWGIKDTWREGNEYRESISLNGLWHFRFPDKNEEVKVPSKNTGWGYFKVPAAWPGKWEGAWRVHTIYGPQGNIVDAEDKTVAWYKRTVDIPAEWKNRRIVINAEMVQNHAIVFVNNDRVGEIFFPGGDVDITSKIRAGEKNEIALLVSAKPSSEFVKNFMAGDRIVLSKASLKFKGLTGDIYLNSYPKKGNVTDIFVIPSYRKSTIGVEMGYEKLIPGRYVAKFFVREKDKDDVVHQFESAEFGAFDSGRVTAESSWVCPKMWDLNTPKNLYTISAELHKVDGEIIDRTCGEEFGFREFYIEGRDFYLNGKKLHLRSLLNESPNKNSANGEIERMRASARRIKELGFNHQIALPYSFGPGQVNYAWGFYKGNSDEGVLTSLTMPHAKDYEWRLDEPETAAQYRKICEYIVRKYQNVPGVILYTTSHNACGYHGDQNPLAFGLTEEEEKTQLAKLGNSMNRKQCLIAEDIIKSLDGTRGLYHHAGGAIGKIYTINNYLNWAPVQERNDWFEVWAKEGRMPLMLIELGLPHVASWSSYRGPLFIHAHPGRQQIWLNEFNAMLMGERAYEMPESTRKWYDNHEKLTAGDKEIVLHRINVSWHEPGESEVRADYVKENLREYRRLGVTGFLPWDEKMYWLAETRDPLTGKDNPNKFDNIKKPGIVPDSFDGGREPNNDLAGTTYRPSVFGAAVEETVQELDAWIGGKIEEPSSRGHNYRLGETIHKSLIILNDSRVEENVSYELKAFGEVVAKGEANVEVGGKKEIAVEIKIPRKANLGKNELSAEFKFSSGKVCRSEFEVDILPAELNPRFDRKILYFGNDDTKKVLSSAGVKFSLAKASNLSSDNILIIGRNSFRDASSTLNLTKFVGDGGRIFVAEQDEKLLNELGFRTLVYGLRNVWDYTGKEYRDWRGSSTLIPWYSEPKDRLNSYGSTMWNGFSNSRVWRAGNRGTVASVLIEKPTHGNFEPLAFGGFDLQYAPALLMHSGKGAVVFSQFDLSGRDDYEPEAECVLVELLTKLDKLNNKKTYNSFLVSVDDDPTSVKSRVEAGAVALAIGLSGENLDKFFPGVFSWKNDRYFSKKVTVKELATVPFTKGICASDLHWRFAKQFDGFVGDDAFISPALAVKKLGKGYVVALQLTGEMIGDEIGLRTSRRRLEFLEEHLKFNVGIISDDNAIKLLSKNFINVCISDISEEWILKADPSKVGEKEEWYRLDYECDKSWRPAKTGTYFQIQYKDLEEYNGNVWYVKEFEMPLGIDKTMPVTFNFGAIDDESKIWLNGEFLGEITEKTPGYWSIPRVYTVNPDKLNYGGKNRITILCNDIRGFGGIMGRPSLKADEVLPLYKDKPIADDDPMRYYRW